MTGPVVVLGSINMDIVTRTIRIPGVGETVMGSDLAYYPGGKGANQAVAAARLGAPVIMIGRVGGDAFAAPLLENLRRNGVDVAWITTDQASASGVATIIVDKAGNNCIVVTPGANGRLLPRDLAAAKSTLQEASLLLLQLEIPLETDCWAIEKAHQAGVRILLNPAPPRALSDALYPMVDFLIPNESEAAMLSGLSVQSLAEAERAGKVLLQKGCGNVILTLGERGCMLITPRQVQHIEAFPVKVVDTVAAGDAFIGGFAAALHEGKSVEEALLWGNAAGALAATRKGAQPSLPDKAELLAFIEKKSAN